MDYMTQLDEILDIIGVKTKPRPQEVNVQAETLKGWVQANRDRSYKNLAQVSSCPEDLARLKSRERVPKSNSDSAALTMKQRSHVESGATQETAERRVEESRDESSAAKQTAENITDESCDERSATQQTTDETVVAQEKQQNEQTVQHSEQTVQQSEQTVQQNKQTVQLKTVPEVAVKRSGDVSLNDQNGAEAESDHQAGEAVSAEKEHIAPGSTSWAEPVENNTEMGDSGISDITEDAQTNADTTKDVQNNADTTEDLQNNADNTKDVQITANTTDAVQINTDTVEDVQINTDTAEDVQIKTDIVRDVIAVADALELTAASLDDDSAVMETGSAARGKRSRSITDNKRAGIVAKSTQPSNDVA